MWSSLRPASGPVLRSCSTCRARSARTASRGSAQVGRLRSRASTSWASTRRCAVTCSRPGGSRSGSRGLLLPISSRAARLPLRGAEPERPPLEEDEGDRRDEKQRDREAEPGVDPCALDERGEYPGVEPPDAS